MNISVCMTEDVYVLTPDATIREAATLMKDIEAGAVPVGENDRLIGMITDRDIAIRAVAEGKSPDTSIRDVMTNELEYVFDDEDIEDVAQKMSARQVRRMPVINREKRLVGIVSLGDLARSADGASTMALRGTSQPGGAHQT